MYQPLADALRPQELSDVCGQQHILGENGLLRRIIESGAVPNMIFYGPSGTGKTTVANLIAKKTQRKLCKLNATTASSADIKEIYAQLDTFLAPNGVLLYLDEIQYFNKKQQQTLLEYIENGKITLIASTTENPYFEVNGALISRSIIFELKPLEKEDIEKLLERAVTDPVKGLGTYNVVLDADAKEFLADIAGGDARAALNAIELGVLSTERQADGKIHIDLETASECIQKRVVRYDKTGDQHYDTISAFIKSMRGSDPDAAVFYLAKMLLETGIQVKIIEQNMKRCEELCELLPKATVIHGDAANHDLLMEEGIHEADALIALTGMDEENIIMALFAKLQGVNKIVAKVNEDSRAQMVEGLGIDSIVSAKSATADAIMSYVRARNESASNVNVESVYQLLGGKVEALEFIIKCECSFTNVPLRELRTKKNNLIACIGRKRRIIIPNGEDHLEVGDSVVVVTMDHIDKFSDILE